MKTRGTIRPCCSTVLSICCIRGPWRLGLSDPLACSMSGVNAAFTEPSALAWKPEDSKIDSYWFARSAPFDSCSLSTASPCFLM